MKPRDRAFIVDLIKLFDLAVMVLSFILAVVVTYEDINAVSFSEFLTMRIKVQNFVLFAGLMWLWQSMFSVFGLYQANRASQIGPAEVADVAKAALAGALAIWFVTIFVKIELITPSSLAVFVVGASAMSILGRAALRMFLRRHSRSPSALSHLVIVGTNARAVALAKRIEANPELGYRLTGFVDQRWSGEEQFRQAGYSVVSDFNGFEDFLKDHVVDEVIICTPVKSLYDWSSRILTQCEQQGITVRFVSDLFTPTIGRSRVERFDEQMVVTVDTGGMTGPTVVIKRLIDFSVSLVLLILSAPLLLATMLAIKLSSAGPIFFVQERVGLNKRRFRLYKFRTMIADAEQRLAELERHNEVTGPVFKIKRDPRITRMGAFLRKTSLDELPQLINVLKGDMSLVGPRPLPVRDYRGFTQHWHRRRFSVRPGITCLWQVGGRNSIPFERWMELDMEYIDQWSLMLDIKILLRTIPAVLKGSGAS
jgi:exopolysaccharide biosynthesis polyprenyl glycosylphosphotransferase